MWVRTRCTFKFDSQLATPFVLMLRPRSSAQRWIFRGEYHLQPSQPDIKL